MDYLADGDVIRIAPRSGNIYVLYRRLSTSNTVFLTGRCNSRCIMCAQPPQTHEDRWAPVWLAAIPLMSQDTAELGISGGEPTLVPDDLVDMIGACRDHLPQTGLQVLSNGRMFNYISLCRAVAQVDHPNLLFGIPVYSDLAYVHDYIVQAKNAFDQTMRGIMNLARCKQRVEIRVVLLRQNVERLPALAYFIARNLPFVEHVALMGLEPMGYAAASWDDVWMDPAEYQPSLKAAVDELTAHRIPVSIFNHQLCTLDESLWPLTKKSISDWKNEYLVACQGCRVCGECGGFFASAKERHSRLIHAL
jgi:His-Xaa-Ser system radical SAM maturase HxsC